jgi:signal transduction histidine kinase/ActR/RegA family two-component response regulator
MGQAIRQFFEGSFMPHGMCYLWQPGILTLHVASDALIAAAYFSIPFTLAYLVRKRRDLEFDWMIACFAIFIVACGSTHLMEILTIWHPVYWLSGSIKAITAAASVPTAVLLIKLMPQALRWPSPAALQRANDELRLFNERLNAEAAERRRAEREVHRVNQELQEQLADMRRLHEVSTRLALAQQLPGFLQEILDTTIALQKADFGSVQLYDADSESLNIVVQRGFSREFIEHFQTVRADGDSACARALKSGARVVIEDVTRDAQYAPHRAIAGREGYRAVQSTPITGPDGTVKGVLSTHFRTPHSLPERDSQLTDLYMHLAAELLERVQNEEAQRAARDEADQANRAKGRFLAAASHDLRQPLQTLSLLTGSLRRLVTDDEAVRAVAEQQQAIGSMSRLLNALLNISTLESGAVTPDIHDFDLAVLFEELRVEFSGPAGSKGLQLEIPNGAAIVRTDPTLLGQVLRNLMSNAIRYTDRGAVRVRCERDNHCLRVDIEDSGVGIGAEHLPHIFEEFYQVGVAPQSVREGHGLGLSIVKRVARLLNHEIRVRSELGRGSTFSLSVPLGSHSSLDQIAAHPPRDGSAAQRPHILIVDDDAAVLSATRMLLKVEGFRVSVAPSLSQAVQLARSHRDIGLLITDFHLGNGETGTAVIDEVRDALGSKVGAVLVSGDTSAAIRDAVADGCVRVASKPLNADELLSLIDSLLRDE